MIFLKTIVPYLIAFSLITGMLDAQAPYSLPELSYATNALEPYIDAQTMEIHHGKHHAAYVNNLNKALAVGVYDNIPLPKELSGALALPKVLLATMTLPQLLLYVGPAGDPIRNNAGGHYNHSHFWRVLAPGGAPYDPQGNFGKAVTASFGSIDSLKKAMNQAASTRFGSGWAWLYLTPEKKLAVASSPNQDNPIMDISEERGIPVLGIDVWEHAYYLKYQNKRGDYLGAIWNVINWSVVAQNYETALSDPLLKLIEKDAWAELKAFDMIMAQTFYPAEEGDLKPIRTHIGEMHEKAVLLQNAKIPKSFATEEMRIAIGRLVTGSAELKKLVERKAKDPVVLEKITMLHDLCYEIRWLCSYKSAPGD